MKYTLLILALAFPLLVHAQQAPTSKPEIPPTVSADLRADYFKARVTVAELNNALERAKKELGVVESKIFLACKPPKYTVQLAPSGDPICVLAPAEPAKEEKK